MHPPIRPPLRILVPALAAVAVLVLAVTPVAAKEGIEARLDAPIPMGTPGGTELLVGVTVTVPDETGADHPVAGTPVYLELTGSDGAVTRAAGAADRTPGHYTMRIAMPAGGARDLEIGIDGTTDLAVIVVGPALTMGGVTPSTAQLAPPAAPALTPFPRAANPVADPAPAPPAAAPADPAAPGPALALLTAVAALLLAGTLVGRRRRAAADRSSAAPSSSAPSASRSA